MAEYLNRISSLLSTKSRNSLDVIDVDPATIFENCITGLKSNHPTTLEFSEFLSESHDRILKSDTAFKVLYFRVFRYCLIDSLSCQALADQGIHWIIISSLENESDYLHERIQAFKIITKIISISAQSLHLAYARSLVALASHNEDPFHKICLESLRDLCVKNPMVVARSNGFRVLFEAVLEVNNNDISESIMLSLLFLLNDPSSRKFIRPQLDLHTLLGPLTDLDSPASDLMPRRRTAHLALVLCLRSWGGITMLASDKMALPTLIRMLQDTKVSPQAQDIILDVFLEVFDPITIKRPANGTQLTPTVPVMNLKNTQMSTHPTPKNSNKYTRTTTTGSPSTSSTTISSFLPISHDPNSMWGTVQKNASPLSKSTASRSDSPGTPSSVSKITSEAVGTTSSSRGTPPLPPPLSISRGYMIPWKGSATNATTTTTTSSGSSNTTTGVHMTKGQHPESAILEGNMSAELNAESLLCLYNASTDMEGDDGDENIDFESAFNRQPSQRVNRTASEDNADFLLTSLTRTIDPLYNLIDSYAAILLCAFLHVKIIDALVFLATHGDQIVAQKGRKLLVNIMKVVSVILPEKWSKDLLVSPSLVQFAASVQSRVKPSRAQKATEMLAALAEAFQTPPFHNVYKTKPIVRVITTGISSTSPLTPTSAAVAVTTSQKISEYAIRRDTTSPVSPAQNFRTTGHYSSNDNLKSVGSASVGNTGGGAGTGGSSTGTTTGGVGVGSNKEKDFTGTFTLTLTSWSVEEMCTEIAQSAFMKINYSSGDANSDMLTQIKMAMIPSCSKLDMLKLLELTRVNGREAKDPLRWDWQVIGDVLEYSFKNPDRLIEALKTKWVKRVSSFYLCKGEDNSMFSNLEWHPGNLYLLEYGCQLYLTLAEQSAGAMFLDQDKKGVLFSDVAKELEGLIVAAQHGTAGSSASSVFTLTNVQQSFTREYFLLLGRMACTGIGQRLLDSSQMFQYISTLGNHACLDYISRAALTALAFSDCGYISSHLLGLWSAAGTCSEELRKYCHVLLSALYRCRPNEFHRWAVEKLSNQLSVDDNHTQHVIKILVEAIQDRLLLKTLILKKPILSLQSSDHYKSEKLLIRFPAVTEGLEYLIENDLILPLINRWKKIGCLKYSYGIESLLSKSLSNASTYTPTQKSLSPIPIEIPAQPCNGSSSGMIGGIQLEGLLRLPWNIEARIESLSSANFETIQLDCFIDLSELPSTLSGDSVADSWRLVKVRGMVVDKTRGDRTTVAISPDKNIKTTLLCGVCPVYRDGTVLCLSEGGNTKFDILKEKSRVSGKSNMPTNNNDSTASSSSSNSSSSSPSHHRRNRSNNDNTPPPSLTTTTTSNLPPPHGNTGSGLPPKPLNTMASGVSSSNSSGHLEGLKISGGGGGAGSSGEWDFTSLSGNTYYEACEWYTCLPLHRDKSVLATATATAASTNTPFGFSPTSHLSYSASTAAKQQATSTANFQKIELDSDRFAIEIDGEPVQWIFNRTHNTNRLPVVNGSFSAPALSTTVDNKSKSLHHSASLASSSSGTCGNSGGVGTTTATTSNMGNITSGHKASVGSVGGTGMPPKDRTYNSNIVYLEEIQFVMRLESNQSLIVPLPRHFYGELARTVTGVSILNTGTIPATYSTSSGGKGGSTGNSNAGAIIEGLLATVKSKKATNTDKRAALWALGHIGAASEEGSNSILDAQNDFLDWCTKQATSSLNFSLRGTCFIVCGLFSRTTTGAARLNALEWDCVPLLTDIAVAVPRKVSLLFAPESIEEETPTTPTKSTTSSTSGGEGSSSSHRKRPSSSAVFPPDSSWRMNVFSPEERDVLTLISKLPGHVLTKDSLYKLEVLHRQSPSLFNSRLLYIAVNELLSEYQLKLALRRKILGFFPLSAKLKEQKVG